MPRPAYAAAAVSSTPVACPATPAATIYCFVSRGERTSTGWAHSNQADPTTICCFTCNMPYLTMRSKTITAFTATLKRLLYSQHVQTPVVTSERPPLARNKPPGATQFRFLVPTTHHPPAAVYCSGCISTSARQAPA
eukprot:GHRQ01017299.1.p1 GENE.GHRQ01017299.1~~GHRQ01017299.1.p1  ORF type:complete len:137 (+),score=11.75 GHRQ01017299.1:258-668(+)